MSPLRIEQLTAVVDPVWLQVVYSVLPRLRPEGVGPPPPVRPEEESDRLAQALTEVLLAFGTVSPHVLLLDDVHLADTESLAWLRSAARRLPSSNVLVVLGYDSEKARATPSVWQALLEIDSRAGSDRLRLTDLDELETAELMSAATGMVPDAAFVDSIVGQTGGNPLLIIEVLRSLTSQLDWSPPQTLSSTARGLLNRRLESTAPSTLRVLQAVSIFDGPIALQAVAKVAGFSKEQALRALDDAVRAAFLVEHEEKLSFANAQLREATRDTIEDAAPLHSRAAQWLEEHPQRAEELARHRLAAGDAVGAAAAYQQAAADAAAMFAFDSAAQLLHKALDAAQIAGIPASEKADVLLHLERALDHLGRRQEQEVILQQLLSGDVDPGAHLEGLRRHVLLLGTMDRYEEAEHVADLAMAHAADHALPTGGILAARGLALSWSGRPSEALGYLQEAAGRTELDPVEAAEAQYALGEVTSSFDPAHAQVELEHAAALFRALGHRRRLADVLGVMATNDASTGHLGTAEAKLREAFDICRQIGFTQGEALHLSNLGSLHYLEGRVAEAVRGYEAALSALSAAPDPRREANTKSNAAYVRYRIMGDDAGASTAAAEALEYYTAVGNPRGIAQAVSILAGVEARRDPAAALALLDEQLDDIESYGPWTAAHLRRRLTEVHLATGDIEGARRHCDSGHHSATAAGLPDVVATFEGLASEIALAAGDRSEALLRARRAVAAIGRGVEQPYLLHFAHHRAAEDADERVAALQEAYRNLDSTLARFTLPERVQARSVPEHRAIMDAWAAHHDITETLQLPAISGNGAIRCVVTVNTSSDLAIPGRRDRRAHRLRRILDEVASQGATAPTSVLATLLEVSPATVRRDRSLLRGQHGN
jgi:tetratricopeptide (TPR) repeat protein